MIDIHMAETCALRYSMDGARGFELSKEIAKLLLAQEDGKTVTAAEWLALARRMHPHEGHPSLCEGFQGHFDAAVWAITQTASSQAGVKALRALVSEAKT